MAIIHKEFNDNPHIVNIELGAGCGNFGQKYHAECFLTEKRTFTEVKLHCTNFFATIFSCDAHDIPCGESRFNHVIMCNPYGYGFNDTENGLLLLSELSRVLINQGRIIILGAQSNKFAMPKRIERRVDEFNAQNSLARFDYMMEEINNLDYPDHTFSYTDAIQSAFPKYRTSLTCYK
jgi:hypothetical protein